MNSHRTTLRGLLLVLLAGVFSGTAHAAVPTTLAFPVVANVSFISDFGAPRGSGSHQGNDIMAPWRSKVVAAETGRVKLHVGSTIGTCMLYLNGRSGTQYVYIHLNNDLTSRSEDSGGCKRGVAYAPGLYSGDRVRRGEFIGFVGDSGDAENGADHLHFEIRPGGGSAINPYKHLLRAKRLLFPRPASVEEIWVRIRGEVTAIGDGSVTMRTKRVRMSNGWRPKVTRSVTVTVPADTAVWRQTTSGLTASTVGSLRVGNAIALRTTNFVPRWAYAVARPGVLQAKGITIF